MAYGKLEIEEIIARRNVNPLSASFPALGNGGAAGGCCVAMECLGHGTSELPTPLAGERPE